MKNLNLYVCDDNKEFSDVMQTKINSYMNNRGEEYKLTLFKSGAELLEQFNKEPSDVVFLDIDMPEMNGLEVAAHLQNRKYDILLIFVTNHEDVVFQTYKYHPFWFIRKSHMHDFDIVLTELIKKINIEEEKRNCFYKLECNNNFIEVDINKLVYISSQRNNLILTYESGEKTTFRCKISEAEKQLSRYGIIRIQRGILVNCRFIYKITCREVTLKNDMVYKLGRNIGPKAREQYQEFVGGRQI